MALNPEITCLIHWADVPKNGVRKKIIATLNECEELAKILGVVALCEVRADFEVSRWRRLGLKVTADISAQAEQNCVVCLEPVSSCIQEQAEWFFEPEERSKKNVDIETVLEIDPLGEDPADPLVDGRVDLWPLLVEHLCLMIDPFKRSTEVEFETVYNEVKETSSSESTENFDASPFAILKTIGKKS